MLIIKKILAFGLLMISLKSQSQFCNCDSAFFETVKLVESNYAGFVDKVNYTSIKEYQKNVRKAKNSKNLTCLEKIDLYLSFFKDSHLRIILDSGQKQYNELRNRYEEGGMNLYEIFYNDQNEKITVYKKGKTFYAYKENLNENESNLYFIARTPPKFKNQRNGVYINSYYQIIPSNIHINKHYLKVNNSSFYNKNNPIGKKVNSKFSYSLIDSNISYLKISTFNSYFKEEIEDVISKNELQIQNSKFLIIDIRDNSGGSIQTFKNLLKYIYDKPIVYLGGWYFASQDNINLYEKRHELYKNSYNEKKLQQETEFIDSLKKNKGKFFETPIDTLVLKEKHINPNKILFLVNEGTGSASEMLLMMASQSNKTIIAGVNTMGATDYLEPQLYKICDNNYYLNIPWVKSYNNILKRKNDNIGITPSVNLNEVPKELWVKSVLQKLSINK